jgi:hypothetical protein
MREFEFEFDFEKELEELILDIGLFGVDIARGCRISISRWRYVMRDRLRFSGRRFSELERVLIREWFSGWLSRFDGVDFESAINKEEFLLSGLGVKRSWYAGLFGVSKERFGSWCRVGLRERELRRMLWNVRVSEEMVRGFLSESVEFE